MTVKPIGDRYLVKPCPQEEVSPGGIIMPQSALDDDQVTTGFVTAVPFVRRDDNCIDREPLSIVKLGDKVLYRPWGGTEVQIDGVKHRLLQENELLAVLQ